MTSKKRSPAGSEPGTHLVSYSPDYSECRWSEQIISQHLHANGVKGNVFADVSKLGTLREELTVIGLWVDLPAWVRRFSGSVDMVRGAVISNTGAST